MGFPESRLVVRPVPDESTKQLVVLLLLLLLLSPGMRHDVNGQRRHEATVYVCMLLRAGIPEDGPKFAPPAQKPCCCAYSMEP